MQYTSSLRHYLETLKDKILRTNTSIGRKSTATAYSRPRLVGHHTDNSSDRFESCYFLWRNKIPAVVWFEDLLFLHKGNTQMLDGDLKLLVQDPQEAANIMCSAGYKVAATNPKVFCEPELVEQSVRMALPWRETGVVLLSARDWCYEMDGSAEGFLPPIHDFLDSMMEYWLRISSQNYKNRLHFALYIGNLINDCYKLKDSKGNAVKDPAYAKMLQPAHRELHYDIVQEDPKADSFTITKRHEYHKRRSQDIKDGLFTPEPYRKGVYRPSLTTLTE